MNKYQAEAITPEMHDLREGKYLHSMSAGVGIPLLQAVVTGIFGAAIVAIIAYKLTSPDWAAWGGVVGLLIASYTWVRGMSLWQYLVQLVERSTGADIDGDGTIAGDEKVIPVRVSVHDGTQVVMARFPDERKLKRVADAVINLNTPLSVREIVERQHLLSRTEFENMRDEMVLRGLLRLKNEEQPGAGYSLTRRGAEMFRELATPSPIE